MKKLNNKGFGHMEIFVVVAAFAIIGVIGGFVWQNSKSKNSSAETGVAEKSSRPGLKLVLGNGGVQISACRTDKPVNSTGDPVNRVNVKATKRTMKNVRSQRASVVGFRNSLSGLMYGYPKSHSSPEQPKVKWGTRNALTDKQSADNTNPKISFYLEYEWKTTAGNATKYRWYNKSKEVRLNQLNPCR